MERQARMAPTGGESWLLERSRTGTPRGVLCRPHPQLARVDGDKVLSTAEHDLGLRVTHDGKGRVLLWVRLGPEVADIDKTWHVVAPLALEAGALDRIAA